MILVKYIIYVIKTLWPIQLKSYNLPASYSSFQQVCTDKQEYELYIQAAKSIKASKKSWLDKRNIDSDPIIYNKIISLSSITDLTNLRRKTGIKF